MLTIICGEDIVASRDYLNQLIKIKKEKEQVVLQTINAADVIELSRQDTQPISLFDTPVYLLENASKKIARKGSGDLYKALQALSKNPKISLFIWESGLSKREVKIADLGAVKEFKPAHSVFTFLDQCYPSNLRNFLTQLRSLSTPQTELFLHIMLTRHMRVLLSLRSGYTSTKLPPWQVGKLKSQASRWDKKKLLDFYDKLLTIEVQLKTGKSVYSVGKSVEMLACYYL